MITIHVYCSYKLSPVGFQYGVLQYPPDPGGDYIPLSQPEENASTSFVKAAFTHGFITEARGKIPDSNACVFLVKRYRYSYPEGHGEAGKDVYANMAFEFDDASQYAHFAKSFDAELKKDEAELKRKQEAVEAVDSVKAIEAELKRNMDENQELKEKLKEPDKFQEAVKEAVKARQYDLTRKMALKGKMADLIHPDYAADDYALTIDRQKLKEFMEPMLKSAEPSDKVEVEKTFFSVRSAQKDESGGLKRLFGLSDVGYFLERIPADGKDYWYGKGDKKKSNRLILAVSLLLLVLLGMLLLARKHERETPNQTAVSAQEEAQRSELPDAAQYLWNDAPTKELPESTQNKS